jgi:hypothetical protein
MHIISALAATCRTLFRSASAAGTILLMAVGFGAIPMPVLADQAIPVRNFLDSLGTGVSPNDSRDPFTKILYLGIHNIRTGYLADLNSSDYAFFIQFAQAGIKLNLLSDSSNLDLAALLGAADKLVPYTGYSGLNIEGLNEINNFGFTWNGIICPGGGGYNTNCSLAGHQYRKALYLAVQQDANLMNSGVRVLDLTGGPETAGAAANCLLSITSCNGSVAEADLGNQHPYLDPSLPNASDSRSIFVQLAGALCIEYTVGCSRGDVADGNSVITEAGYNSCYAPDRTACTNGISQTAQALLIIDYWLSAFANGIPRTYIYTMIDDWWGGFGFWNIDGTVAKQIATVTHNLTTILADNGPVGALGPGGPVEPVGAVGPPPVRPPPPVGPRPPAGLFAPLQDRLNYVLRKIPPYGHALLLQKSTGAFDLILWNEAQVWDGTTDVPVTPVSVTVDLGGRYSRVQVFNPYISTLAQATYSGIGSLTVNLGSQAQIIEITP